MAALSSKPTALHEHDSVCTTVAGCDILQGGGSDDNSNDGSDDSGDDNCNVGHDIFQKDANKRGKSTSCEVLSATKVTSEADEAAWYNLRKLGMEDRLN